MMYKQGELILIPVPFSDLSAKKRRPVVVISNDTYNKANSDILVAAVTSNTKERPYAVELKQEDMKSGALPKPSHVRADKLYSLSSDIVIKPVGHMSETCRNLLIRQIDQLIR